MDGEGLTIVIPALDEEEAIGHTIARCLAARDQIKEAAGLAFVEIIVVSDGSTDRTVEIARGFDEVEVIVFTENRGYGAAIKAGWQRGRGDRLGFLDADGTCDPIHFGQLCRLGAEHSADIVLGSRLGPDSQMPRLRRLGNRFYALLLGLLCGHRVTDTASGMRVVRRAALDDLYPLPDGLHFTPSMSARALLNGLRVVEMPMPYGRRIGKSKLNVLTDGVVFLRTILSGVLCYRPEKVFLLGCTLCAVFILLLAAQPVRFYSHTRRLEEWMIYRFVVCQLLGSFALLLLLAAALANRMAHFSPRRPEASRFRSSAIAAVLRGRVLGVIIAVLLVSTLLFLWPGIVQYATTGTTNLHWSRLLAGAFSLFSLLQTAVFAVLMKVVEIWRVQRSGDGKGVRNLLDGKGVRNLLPERPEGCFAQKVPDTFSPPEIVTWEEGVACCNAEWEAAYARFETPAEETAKFVRRYQRLGFENLPRDLHVVELFCGRGNGLKALAQLGFTCLEGVDLSPELLRQYDGPATLYVGDCRRLRFADRSKDVLVVHGGLHHLPSLPSALDEVLAQVHRVLKPSGRFAVVEPWPTPFLRFVHWVCGFGAARKVWPKLDALACMTEHELDTYRRWLGQPDAIIQRLHRRFVPEIQRMRFGKLMFLGGKRP